MSTSEPRPVVGGRAPLRLRLLVSFLVLALIPLFVSNAIGYGRSKVIVEELAVRYLKGVADLQASEVRRRVLQELQYLRAVAEGNRFLEAALERRRHGAGALAMSREATEDAVARYLERKRGETGHFRVLALYALDGSLVAAAASEVKQGGPGERSAGEDGDAPPRRLVPDDSLELLDAVAPHTPPVLRVLAPVRLTTGEALGFLMGTIPLENGHAFLEFPEHVAGAVESFVLDDRGRPVFVSHPHGPLDYRSPFESPLLEPAARGAGDGRYVNREGQKVMAVRAPVGLLGWTLLTEVAEEDALGALRRLRLLSIPLAVLFSSVVVLGAWLLAGQIVAPVRHLVVGTRRIAAGDFEARVPVTGDDELADLARAFNEMAEELARSRDRIRLLHRREIERAEQLATVGELASGVAHEIKNPVVGISNGMDLVLRRVGDDPELKPIAKEMQRQLRRIEGAVRDLLAFARPPDPTPEPTDLNEVVTRVRALLEPMASQASVRLELELDPALPRIDVDPDLLMQAVVNVTMNGIQFSPEGGRVLVRTEAHEDTVSIVIRDEGEGVRDDVRKQLFKPFFTTRHSGTGLGLTITWGIVRRHGGHIEVENGTERGAVFTIVLPRSDGGGDVSGGVGREAQVRSRTHDDERTS